MKEKVLVVDDEKGIREYYKDLLQENGYEVYTAKNAKDGLQVASENELDLILLDINMPDLNGLDALKKIKEMDARIPVFLLTAHEKYKRNFASLYAEEYIVKDKKPDFIVRKIGEKLRSTA